MIAKSLRGLAVALAIGTATVAVAGLSTVSVAQAAGVRPEVGKPLQEALKLAERGKGRAALAKVSEAEHVKKLTAEERKVIAQTKQYVMIKTGDFSGGVTNATTAKAKFAADYRAGRYRAVVSTDVDLLRKYGAYDGQSEILVAQAYYEMGQYKNALNILNRLGNSDQVINLRMATASKMGDSAMVGRSAEELVLKGQSKYWPYLFIAADNAHGLNDDQTLGIYRVRLRTGHMRNTEDYSNATQLAILLGLPQEAVGIEQKGFDAKVLSGQRQERLLARAKESAAEQAKKMPAIIKAANAAKNGDALVKLAEIYWGAGKYHEAVDAVEAGLKKGVTDKSHAEMVLGMAYTGLKKTSQAVRAFNKVSGKGKPVARLWSVYARTR